MEYLVFVCILGPAQELTISFNLYLYMGNKEPDYNTYSWKAED